MNKSELVAAIAERTETTKAAAEEALRATIEVISEQLAGGEQITLIGFGTFKVAKREARKGRNPQTGKEIDIPEKNVVKFSPGKALDESVNVAPKPKKKASCKKC